MQKFTIKSLATEKIESELEKIGFDIAYRAQASDKFRYKTFKIFDCLGQIFSMTRFYNDLPNKTSSSTFMKSWSWSGEINIVIRF